MPKLLLTPASISYLAQLILAFSMTGYLALRLASRKAGEPHLIHLTISLFCITMFSGLLFLDGALLPTPRLVAVYLENTFLGLVLAFFIQFAYHFPNRFPQRKWEARFAFALSMVYVFYEVFFAIYRFILLQQGTVEYRSQGADYALILLVLCIPIAFARQCVLADEQPVAQLKKLWNPQGIRARALRNFAMVFTMPIVLGVANILRGESGISTSLFNMILSLGFLAILELLAIVYINSMPPMATSFLVKISGTTLTLLLAILGSSSWVLAPNYIAEYRPMLKNQQSLRFTPNAQGGYDIAEIPFYYEADLGQKLPVTSRGGERDYKVNFIFPFYGRIHSEIYVTSVGLVKMGESLEHANLQNNYGRFPGIFPLLIDLEPTSAGGVFARLAQDRLVVTWNKLPSVQQPESLFTFQTILFSDGRFDINYIDLPSRAVFNPDATPSANIWLRGATPGTAEPVLQVADLSQATQSGPNGILQDFNISFREYLNKFVLPLFWLLIISAVLLFVGVPLLLNASLVRPLNALLAGVEQVDQGNLDVVIPTRDFDEFGVLTRSFNKMIAWLKSLVTGLEQRINERTFELELTNSLWQEEMSIRQKSQAQLVEQQRTLAALDERERMSRDLHDGLAQVMSSINLQTQAAQAYFAQGQAESANASLERILILSRDANASIRHFILGLRTQQQPTADFFSALVEYLREYSNETGIQARLSTPSDYSLPMLAPAAEAQVLHIVQEALANIRKHAQAHRAEVIFIADERGIQIAILDDGIGFDTRQRFSEDLPHFGLSMMRERVKILGGRLDVRSAPGQGTKVLVFIPQQMVETAPSVTKTLLDLRLLLVDDSPIFLEGLRNLLSARGMTVVGMAFDGLEAQEKVRQLRPDVVVMDVLMPRCNGIEATFAIKTEFPDIKVVMLTTSEKEEHLFDAIKNGASGFLLKGTDANEFCAALEKLANGETILSPHIAASLITEFSRSGQELTAASIAADEYLSDVQSQILELVASGNTYKEIGAKLNLTERTIKYHMKQILERLHLKNRADMLNYLKARAKEK